MSKYRLAVLIPLCLLAPAAARDALAQGTRTQEPPRPTVAESPREKSWQAVAPGRVEPASGEIRMVAPVVGRIGQVLVKANDKVFAGEPLIRLEDDEARARLATAEAQIGMRKRLRNEQSPSSRAADRRKAEDAVADGEKAVVEAQAAVDRAAAARRAGSGSDADLDNVRAALAGAQERLVQRKAELRRVEADAPLPTLVEGQLTIARTELAAAEAAIEKMTIRAPIAGSVLEVNARLGEIAGPTSTRPLVIVGDTSALRVRAEVDERDFGEIRIGQGVVVGAAAFGGREFAGKVSSIAPIVESSSISARGLHTRNDVDIVEVLVDLAEPGPLAVGMKVDVYFRTDSP